MRIDVKGTIVSNDDAWIYDWYEIENTTPKIVSDIIKSANGQPLDVYINSGGGDLFAGMEMYSALRDYSGQVSTHIQSMAGSAASIVAIAQCEQFNRKRICRQYFR